MELPAFAYFGISTYSEEIAEPSMVFCNCSTESSMCRLHVICYPTFQLFSYLKKLKRHKLKS
jgi:hypothetical protein